MKKKVLFIILQPLALNIVKLILFRAELDCNFSEDVISFFIGLKNLLWKIKSS